MNVIFLDFDGALYGIHDAYDENYNQVDNETFNKRVEKRIEILSEACKEYDCKVVIESSYKHLIDEETLETDIEWINDILVMMKKHGIEVIGRTKNLEDIRDDYDGNPTIWKEDEILAYLDEHPEIEHYCVIDDDDLGNMHMKSDLDKVRNHLIKTELSNRDHPEKTGLQPHHKEEIGRIIKKEIDKSKIRRLV